MNKPYYRTSLDFKRFFERKELKKISLQESISQFISILITTYFEEYSFDDEFGSEIWETDFDLLINANVLKERIKKSLLNQISTYEKRLHKVDLRIDLRESLSERTKTVRLKKYLNIQIRGTIVKTDEPYRFVGDYYLAPLSYK